MKMASQTVGGSLTFRSTGSAEQRQQGRGPVLIVVFLSKKINFQWKAEGKERGNMLSTCYPRARLLVINTKEQGKTRSLHLTFVELARPFHVCTQIS